MSPIIIEMSSCIFLVSLFFYLFFIFKKRKDLFRFFYKIPKPIIVANTALLIWRLFFIPHNFTSRGTYGVWLMMKAKKLNWIEIFTDWQAPIHYASIKFFSQLLDGVGYGFVVNLHIFLYFLSVFLVYLLAQKMFKNRDVAYFTTIFYAICPIFFNLSLTENYTNLALFFTIQALFFAVIYFNSHKKIFLFGSMSSSILAAGSRPEYIFLPYLLILFYLLIPNKKRKLYYKYLIGFFIITIPKTLVSLKTFLFTAQIDPHIHGTIYNQTSSDLNFLFEVILGHSTLFIENLFKNLKAFLNPITLTVLFIVLSAVGLYYSLVKENKKRNKKYIIFFSIFFFGSYLYYTYFHSEGIRHFEYLTTVAFPLVMLSGYGLKYTYEKYKEWALLILEAAFLVFLTIIILPLSFRSLAPSYKNLSKKHFFSASMGPVREYREFKKLTYENRVSRLLSPFKEINVKKGPQTYFISNSPRTFLYAMPFQTKIMEVSSLEKLSALNKNLPSGAIIYATQGKISSSRESFNRYKPIQQIKGNKFERKIKKIFRLKKKLIFYQKNDRLIFLYKMKKK